VEKKVKLDQNKVSLQKKDIKEDQDKVKEKEVREPASAEITDKNEEESSNTKLYVFLIIILAFFTYLFIGRVRD
jgi:ABC-type Na+ efflux pump permease subunit